MSTPWLARANQDLHRLVNYLIDVHHFPKAFRKLSVAYVIEHDTVNSRDPRAFCYVEDDKWQIFCSRAIEDVPPAVRIGILLHEITHLKIPAFAGASAEVDVDDYVIRNFPEAGYCYKDCKYWSHVVEDRVIARNVEHVATDFVELLHRIEERPHV